MNERRIKSDAIKAIVKQMQRLSKLELIKLSTIFVLEDKTQERQRTKYIGQGRFLLRLQSETPILDRHELDRAVPYKEEFMPRPKKGQVVSSITPSKLPCGPGVSKQLAARQMDLLASRDLVLGDKEDSFSIEVDSPQRKKKKTMTCSRRLVNDDSIDNEEDGVHVIDMDLEMLNSPEPSAKKTAQKKSTQMKKKTQKENDLPKLKAPRKKRITKKKTANVQKALEDKTTDLQNQINESVSDDQTSRHDGNMDVVDTGTLHVTTLDEIRQSNNEDDLFFIEDLHEEIPFETNQLEQEKEVTIGSYVAVAYNTAWYPGLVMEEEGDEAIIKFLHPVSAGNDFKWPQREDQDKVKKHFIFKKNLELFAKDSHGRLWQIDAAQFEEIKKQYKSFSEKYFG